MQTDPNECAPKTAEVKPDKELLLWEKWIQIRNEETKKLGQHLDKPPADLAMNLLENLREDKERKTVLEHAQIEKKPMVRRSYWERPQRLKQQCYCRPVYEVHRTPAEKGNPRVIEHIGVPNYILETEKGLSGTPERINCNLLNREYKEYIGKRENELKENIKKIDPFRPHMNELIIRGSKPKTPPKKMPPVPKITVDMSIKINEETLCSIYAIRINNTVIIKDIPDQNLSHLRNIYQEPWNEPCISWTYYFHVPIKRAGRSKIFFQNLGTVTLRYCWKKIKRSIPYIPDDAQEQVFFFNKNEDVLSPGQSREIVFTFICERPGIYNESWEFSPCNVSFFNALTEKLVVNLSGDATEDMERTIKKVEVLKCRIHTKVIHNIARDILNTILDKVTVTKPQVYPYKHYFLEAEMFVMKNPVCFYHQTEVLKMKDLYSEMVPGEVWDLSISSWREQMMAQDFDERMKYYELLRKSHTEFLKPWYEGDALLNQKYRAMNLLLGQLADKFDAEYQRISLLYGVVQRPQESTGVGSSQLLITPTDNFIENTIRNVFYLSMYEYTATTIEVCAGVLSSLDLNRWIDFDFCRW